MNHPGESWTTACAAVMAAWGVGGSAYITRRSRPVMHRAQLATRHATAARRSESSMGQCVHMAKARHHIRANDHTLKATGRFSAWVYEPVLGLLTLATLGLAVWGLL